MSDSHPQQENPTESNSGAMRQSDRFDSIERRLLFRITRFAALFLSLLLVATIGGCLVYMYNANRPEKPPTADEVVNAIAPPPTDGQTLSRSKDVANQEMTQKSNRADLQLGKSTDVLVGLRIPIELQVLFADDENSLDAIRRWIDELAESDRQGFLDQLGRAAMLAKQRGVDQVAAINEFYKRHAQARARSASNSASAAAARLNALYVAGLALTMLVLLSLILVLLAIERNTRPLERVR